MFNVTFEDGPFFGDYPEESLFSNHNLLEIYRDKDSSNLFSEYDFDELEDELLDALEVEHGFAEEEDDPETDHPVMEDEDDDFDFLGESEEVEEDWDDLEEEGFDFFIPAEVPYSEKYLFRDSFFKSKNPDDFIPFELDQVFKSEMFDDILLIEQSFWLSELLVDRFLINISEQHDVAFDHDFLTVAKISQYGPGLFDQNILNLKSTDFRNYYIKFFKNVKLNCQVVGISFNLG